MNSRTIRFALKMLNARTASPQGALNRVASRWLVANASLQYDILIRLQFLEGVAHVPQGTWSRLGKFGLPKAMKHFEGQAVQNVWFDAGNSGMFKIIYGTLRTVINRFPAIHGTDPFEILDGALMGLGQGTDFATDRSMTVYETGRFLHTKVLSGDETPESVGKGMLSKHMVRRVYTLAKQTKEVQMGVDDEGNQMDVKDPGRTISALDFLAGLIFMQSPDPLAKAIQDLAAKTWANSAPMTIWLTHVLQDGEIPKGNQVAEEAGVSVQTFSQRHWRPAWIKFSQALYADKALKQAIETRMIQEGINDELPDALQDIAIRTDRMASGSRFPQQGLRTVLAFLPVFFTRFAGTKIR